MIVILKNIVDHERGRVRRTVTPTNVTDFYIGTLNVRNISRSGQKVREGFYNAFKDRIDQAEALGLIEVKIVGRASDDDTKEISLKSIQSKIEETKEAEPAITVANNIVEPAPENSVENPDADMLKEIEDIETVIEEQTDDADDDGVASIEAPQEADDVSDEDIEAPSNVEEVSDKPPPKKQSRKRGKSKKRRA